MRGSWIALTDALELEVLERCSAEMTVEELVADIAADFGVYGGGEKEAAATAAAFGGEGNGENMDGGEDEEKVTGRGGAAKEEELSAAVYAGEAVEGGAAAATPAAATSLEAVHLAVDARLQHLYELRLIAID